jgi:hypothetical protein
MMPLLSYTKHVWQQSTASTCSCLTAAKFVCHSAPTMAPIVPRACPPEFLYRENWKWWKVVSKIALMATVKTTHSTTIWMKFCVISTRIALPTMESVLDGNVKDIYKIFHWTARQLVVTRRKIQEVHKLKFRLDLYMELWARYFVI